MIVFQREEKLLQSHPIELHIEFIFDEYITLVSEIFTYMFI